jgi:type II secretion system protein E
MLTKKDNLLLGQILVSKGLITNDQLEAALRHQKKTGEFLGVTLSNLGFLKEADMIPVLAKQLDVEYLRLENTNIDSTVIAKVPAKFACHYRLIPLSLKDNVLTIAVSDPMDIHMLDDIRLLLNLDIKPVLAGETDILDAIKKYYGIGAETIEKIMDQAGQANQLPVLPAKTLDIQDMADDASIVKFVNQILFEAFSERATDIHIEPFEKDLKIRYRIDGVLYDAAIPPTIKYFQAPIVSRIKIMAGLNIAERRMPQDGRIKISIGNTELDIRVSILPTPYGESIDLRLLSTGMLYSLPTLGLSSQDLGILEQMIKKPHGIIFVTGPTGSGKTTTLYACLTKIKDATKKIITIEDPIEYQMEGITQIQVMPKIGLTFAEGLRSSLRHDPDIMMVGEVRDTETAEIAIRVALTGHLVFSTLHTNDAAGAITRLLDMGIEPFLVGSSVQCIIAQRLVRTICNKCKALVKDKKPFLKNVDFIKDARGKIDLEKIDIYEGKGCDECKFTGYRGRTGIYEFLVLNEPITELILRRASSDQIKRKALDLGMHTLMQDGLEKVLRGITTFAEVARVCELKEE